jgi:hypothetical protein
VSTVTAATLRSVLSQVPVYVPPLVMTIGAARSVRPSSRSSSLARFFRLGLLFRV